MVLSTRKSATSHILKYKKIQDVINTEIKIAIPPDLVAKDECEDLMIYIINNIFMQEIFLR